MENPQGRKPNHLINEVSPYLLQHAYNPVDWYPWGKEAFEKAIKEGKPIFLSIGYSTCHWCHVMEKESFEDSTIARLMNETFVSIKVDREERPEIDNIYMKVAQALTGSGGWPLTILLTPDKKPFFAATYIPRNSRYGRIGLIDLIKKVKELWLNKREDIVSSANQVASYLKNKESVTAGVKLSPSVFKETFDVFTQSYDGYNGGFGIAPKFPQPRNLLFLLRYWSRTKNPKALAMVENTLHKLRLGGIFDQLGFGFHRYSTDKLWRLPHFEKMLYTQSELALVYAEAFQATRKDFYKKTTGEIFDYVFREMTSPEGAFYSAEDADSEGEEGKFYVWSFEDLRKALNTEEFEILKTAMEIKKEGNFLEEATGSRIGKNILYFKSDFNTAAGQLHFSKKIFLQKFELIREKLFKLRERRIHPFKDDKILTNWNALMIASLARSARIFNNPEYLNAAEKAYNFIRENLLKGNKLLHRFRNGVANISANAEDYSFLIYALLELYESSFNIKYLNDAIWLNNYFIKHFLDEQKGGFFFASDNAEKLPANSKEFFDGSTPSSNSIAYFNLVRLAKLTANKKFENMAFKLSKLFSGLIEKNPTAYSQFLIGFDFEVNPSSEVVIVGNKNDALTLEMIKNLREHYFPQKVVLLLTEENREVLIKLSPFLNAYGQINNKTTAYVCRNFVCNLPVNNSAEMIEQLILPRGN